MSVSCLQEIHPREAFRVFSGVRHCHGVPEDARGKRGPLSYASQKVRPDSISEKERRNGKRCDAPAPRDFVCVHKRRGEAAETKVVLCMYQGN